MTNKTITFDKESKKHILELLEKEVDEKGFIVEKSTGERVLTSEGEEIRLEEFGGFKKGSQVFIKSDINALIKFANKI